MKLSHISNMSSVFACPANDTASRHGVNEGFIEPSSLLKPWQSVLEYHKHGIADKNHRPSMREYFSMRTLLSDSSVYRPSVALKTYSYSHQTTQTHSCCRSGNSKRRFCSWTKGAARWIDQCADLYRRASIDTDNSTQKSAVMIFACITKFCSSIL